LRAVVQRVSEARVLVDGSVVGEVGAGICVLIGFDASDTEPEVARFARKVAQLRIFEDAEGRMTSSVLDGDGSALVVSQFTLIADSKRQRGTRPSFTHAARPEQAEPLYEAFIAALRGEGVEVQTGVFGAYMQLELVNDGPVTIILET
jgi:D-tyrosyl-tRNA(Tyr) deacylase